MCTGINVSRTFEILYNFVIINSNVNQCARTTNVQDQFLVNKLLKNISHDYLAFYYMKVFHILVINLRLVVSVFHLFSPVMKLLRMSIRKDWVRRIHKTDSPYTLTSGLYLFTFSNSRVVQLRNCFNCCVGAHKWNKMELKTYTLKHC